MISAITECDLVTLISDMMVTCMCDSVLIFHHGQPQAIQYSKQEGRSLTLVVGGLTASK